MTYFVSGIVLIAWLLAMVVSTIMNVRYGMSLGVSEGDKIIFGGVSLASDMFKATLPLVVLWCARSRFYIRSFIAMLVCIVCFGYSVASSIGFASVNRSDTTAERSGKVQRYEDLRRSLRFLRERLTSVSSARPTGTIEADLKRHEQQRRWASTKGCTDATATKSRKFCERYFSLKAEFADAQSAKDIRRKIGLTESKLEVMKSAPSSADPQADILMRLTGLELSTVSLWQSLLMATLVEFGSGFGLFLAFCHGQFRWHDQNLSHAMMARSKKLLSLTGLSRRSDDDAACHDASQTGDVATYALERIALGTPGNRIPIVNLYGDYERWSAGCGKRALGEATFVEHLIVLTELLGVEVVTERSGRMVCNATLVA